MVVFASQGKDAKDEAMTTPAQIDTTSLLTILSVIAAVWALLSPVSRLRLRFCMAFGDWVLVAAAFFLIHYLVFSPVLEDVGLYYSFGPWKWGLDSSSAVYLLLLPVVFYFFWRIKSPSLARGRVRIFRELIDNLHLTKRYDELVLLVEPQLPKLMLLAKQQSLLVRWIDRLDPPCMDMALLLRGEKLRAKPFLGKHCSAALQSLKAWLRRHDETGSQAREVLLNLVTSPGLVAYLAVAHPYFCLKLLESEEAIQSDFIEHYVDALLDEPVSRLYVELKNNQNLNGGSRLSLPESNRLLRFFFADAAAVLGKGLSRAIGEAICRRLDEDHRLAERLKQPLGYYYEAGKFRCPINSGITLFEIMVHEGISQGLQDHMWLHYYRHFTVGILRQMPVSGGERVLQEWPTPFHYLLYRLISVSRDWILQCKYIKDSDIPLATSETEGFDRYYISKEAVKLLGSMLEEIIVSDNVSDSFKVYLLEGVMRCYEEINSSGELACVRSSFIQAVISGVDLPTDESYRIKLGQLFGEMDHTLRIRSVSFKKALDESF